jgi:hypothetical protein
MLSRGLPSILHIKWCCVVEDNNRTMRSYNGNYIFFFIMGFHVLDECFMSFLIQLVIIMPFQGLQNSKHGIIY